MTPSLVIFNVPLQGTSKSHKGLYSSEPADLAHDQDGLSYDVLQVDGNRYCTVVINLDGRIIRVKMRLDRRKRGSTDGRLPQGGRCVGDIQSPGTSKPTRKPGQDPQVCR